MELKNILDGWENFIDKSEVVENVAKERALKCSQCPELKHGKLLAFIKDELTQIQGCYCNKCKCPLSAKIRSNDKCPLGKW